MSGKRVPGAIEQRRSGQALELFEKAIRALGKKDYERAHTHFASLLELHKDQPDLAERARVYMLVCERELRPPAAFKPKTVEELLTHGVMLHNAESFAEAAKCFRRAAEQAPKSEHAHYCLAASLARTGDSAGAVLALRDAITVSSASRAQARYDADFDSIRDDPEFDALIEAV
jgi:tetratricopeptide (TPR) repeat protein